MPQFSAFFEIYSRPCRAKNATNEAFFLNEKMYEAHDALLCIGEKKLLSDRDRRRVSVNHSFKSSKDMVDVFNDLPEAIENTINIAKRCF